MKPRPMLSAMLYPNKYSRKSIIYFDLFAKNTARLISLNAKNEARIGPTKIRKLYPDLKAMPKYLRAQFK